MSGGKGRRPSSGLSPQGCRGEVPASPRGFQTLSEVRFGRPVTWAASWEKPQFPWQLECQEFWVCAKK